MNLITHLIPATWDGFSINRAPPTVADEGGRTLFDFSNPDAAQAWPPVNGQRCGLSRLRSTKAPFDPKLCDLAKINERLARRAET